MYRHRVHGRPRMAILVVVALIAAHVALLGFVPRGHMSLVMVGGVAVMLVLKYARWRFRRSRNGLLTQSADSGDCSEGRGGA